jgi:hypothetical protein
MLIKAALEFGSIYLIWKPQLDGLETGLRRGLNPIQNRQILEHRRYVCRKL